METKENTPSRIFTDSATIDQVHSLIFNESFFVDEVRYDTEKKLVIIPFMRCFQGDDYKVIKRNLFREVYELPVLKCELRIHDAEEFKLVDRGQVERHIFQALSYDKKVGRMDIKSYMPLDFYVYVSSFHIEYIELMKQGRAVFSQGRFIFNWESGPKFLDI